MKTYKLSGWADDIPCVVEIRAASKEQAISLAESMYDMEVLGCEEFDE
jgi:hypothetical protein